MSRDTRDARTDAASSSGDDDIAALFAAQADDIAIPPELDASIRAAAREPVSSVAADTSEAGPSPDAGTEHTRPAVVRYRSPPRWLAAAAVVVLALALVPLVRQAPESRETPSAGAPPPSATDASGARDRELSVAVETLDETVVERAPDAKHSVDAAAMGATVAADAYDALQPIDAEEAGAADDESRAMPSAEALVDVAPVARRTTPPVPPSAPAADAPLAEADAPATAGTRAAETDAVAGSGVGSGVGAGAAIDITREPAPVAGTKLRQATPSTFPEASRQSLVPRPADRPSSFVGADPMATPAGDPFDGFRETPAAWLERLRERLRAEGLTPRLQAEYRRFRSSHPDIEPAFDPEAVAREGAATRR